MPDDSRTPDVRRGPASPQRRKLIVTGSFAAAGALVLRGLPTDDHHRSGTPRARTTTTARAMPLVEPPALAGADAQPGADHTYDTVITAGRVIDPDSGFSGVLNVGIDGNKITGFGERVRSGRRMINAKGRVVCPGFIDVLSYEPNPRGSWYKIADGVTTNLGMHGMQQGWWLPDFFDRYAKTTPVNFGGAFSDHWVRFHKLGLDVGSTANTSQISQLAELCEAQVRNGWLGVALEPEYTPGVDFAEMLGLAKVAKRLDVPCFVHGRYSSYSKERETVPEIIRLGEQSGAAVHVTHLPSTGGTWHIDAALQQIDAATDAGHDVTFGLYPYAYWGTYAASTRFAPGWQERFQITYRDLQIAGTRERLNASSFASAKAENALTIAYAIPESSVRKALTHPRSLIGSDAIVDTGNNHPRASGTFCRVLGYWVREKKALTLAEAIAKMTILPARRLEKACPQLGTRGRIQRGADADMCIFDPDTVTDRATVAEPVAYSTGIDWVLVGGSVVKDPNGTKSEALGGAPIRSQIT